jgi:predicted nucleic acid-binding protein
MSVDFIDSNVFVYLFDETDPAKRETASDLVRAALGSTTYLISFQVVQEVLNIITQKLKVPVKASDAVSFFEQVFAPLWQVMPSHELYRRSIQVKERYGYGYYDSLIIGAALEAGCRRVLSEDLHDGQKIEGLTIVNPFQA